VSPDYDDHHHQHLHRRRRHRHHNIPFIPLLTNVHRALMKFIKYFQLVDKVTGCSAVVKDINVTSLQRQQEYTVSRRTRQQKRDIICYCHVTRIYVNDNIIS
jgi:hypothetical protein